MTREHATKAKNGYTTANEIARILREELLSAKQGAFIGSANDLMARYGISRSTMRQAVRVLEHEQLLISKRGISGGFYVGRPRIDSVVAACASYLHFRNVTVKDLIAVARTLNVELARLAAQCTDTDLRGTLARSLDENWRQDFASTAALVRAGRELEGLLSAMAGSPVIELLLKVVYDLGIKSSTSTQVPNTPERIAVWRQHRLELCEAILAGDVDWAEKVGRRHYDIVETWL